jgi:hypothetical protein
VAPNFSAEIALEEIAVAVTPVKREDQDGQNECHGQERPIQKGVVLIKGKQWFDHYQDDVKDQARQTL